MRKRFLLLGLLWASVAAALAGSAAALGTSWGKAVQVPGTAVLNSGSNADVNAVSCVAAGACVAGGFYTDGSGHEQAFVVSEKRGRWGKAVQVPGTAVLNGGGSAKVASVSCVATGKCVAGGIYKDASTHFQAFVSDGKVLAPKP